MSSHFQLYGRPLDIDGALPLMFITGFLQDYVPGEAYEGRLQIHNSIGKCTVQIVESDLPPGAFAFVDNFTKEIVLKWPAFTEPGTPTSVVPNGDFEAGDQGWTKGAGWNIETGGALTGSWNAVYYGRGKSTLAGTRVPVNPGTSITATGQVHQGASSKNNVVAGILLSWYSSAGILVRSDAGNIVSSGSNGAWHPSTVTATAPATAALVAVDVLAERRKENKVLRVDDITWDHVYDVGQTGDSPLYFVKFLAKDAANQEATWEGFISSSALIGTSRPYSLDITEELQFLQGVVRGRDEGIIFEEAAFTQNIISGQLRDTIQTYNNYPIENTTFTQAVLSGTIKDILVPYNNYAVENTNFTQNILSGTLKVTLISYNNYAVENVNFTQNILSGTLT